MMPYYPTKGSQLAAIRAQLLRIARLFLDPELNTKRISYEGVKYFIREVIGFSEELATSEADRYCFKMPGQAAAYRYGAMKIMDLGNELKESLGNNFKLKDFHDAVLSFGFLPIEISRNFIKDKLILEAQELRSD